MAAEKVLFVSATEYAVEHFAAPYIAALVEDSVDVHVATGTEIGNYIPPAGVTSITIGLRRKPSIRSDVRELFELTKLMRHERYDSVYSISPKGGLVAQLAAWLARAPHRVHFFTGQIWKMKTGAERQMLKRLDNVINRVISKGYVDSRSQADFLIEEGVLSSRKAVVLGSGSVSGIVVEDFPYSDEHRREIRQRHGFSDDNIVVFFLGRISTIKGVRELVTAFEKAHAQNDRLRLLLVGPDDGELEAVQALISKLGIEHLIAAEWESTPRPAVHYSAADIFCVPSYMEGFGNVVLESACAGVPTIGSDIYGLQDSIADGVTGLLFPPGDTNELAAAIVRLADDPILREELGRNAAKRVEEEFTQERLVEEFMREHRAGR